MITTFAVGDAVYVPSSFCPSCDQRTGLMSGIVTGFVQTSKLEDDGHVGPFYTVLIDHEHNASGHLVYDESELTRPGTQLQL